jgi:hypothetical protein
MVMLLVMEGKLHHPHHFFSLPWANLMLEKHATDFLVLAHIAYDIPRVNISVKWLFSSSKQMLSDTHSSLITEYASKTVVVKE